MNWSPPASSARKTSTLRPIRAKVTVGKRSPLRIVVADREHAGLSLLRHRVRRDHSQGQGEVYSASLHPKHAEGGFSATVVRRTTSRPAIEGGRSRPLGLTLRGYEGFRDGRTSLSRGLWRCGPGLPVSRIDRRGCRRRGGAGGGRSRLTSRPPRRTPLSRLSHRQAKPIKSQPRPPRARTKSLQALRRPLPARTSQRRALPRRRRARRAAILPMRSTPPWSRRAMAIRSLPIPPPSRRAKPSSSLPIPPHLLPARLSSAAAASRPRSRRAAAGRPHRGGNQVEASRPCPAQGGSGGRSCRA